MGQDSVLLRSYGRTAPATPVTEDQVQKYNQHQEEEKKKRPLWKQYANKVFDTGIGFIEGLTGLGSYEPKMEEGVLQNPAGARDYGTGLGEVLPSLAGLPFAAYKNKLPLGKIFHGSKKAFEKFDPSKYDTSDVLGWMTHAAEDPAYAGQYALGEMKHAYGKIRSTMLPLEPEAKNVLDLIEPNLDDLNQAIAFAGPWDRAQLIERFKQIRGITRDENLHPSQVKEAVRPFFNTYAQMERPVNEIPRQFLADKLRLGESATEAMPFDAIRYRDMDKESWALPKKTPIKSALSDHYFQDPIPESQIKGFKVDLDAPHGGDLVIRNSGSTGKSAAQQMMESEKKLHPEEWESVTEAEKNLHKFSTSVSNLYKSYKNNTITKKIFDDSFNHATQQWDIPTDKADDFLKSLETPEPPPAHVNGLDFSDQDTLNEGWDTLIYDFGKGTMDEAQLKDFVTEMYAQNPYGTLKAAKNYGGTTAQYKALSEVSGIALEDLKDQYWAGGVDEMLAAYGMQTLNPNYKPPTKLGNFSALAEAPINWPKDNDVVYFNYPNNEYGNIPSYGGAPVTPTILNMLMNKNLIDEKEYHHVLDLIEAKKAGYKQ